MRSPADALQARKEIPLLPATIADFKSALERVREAEEALRWEMEMEEEWLN
jgi:hypothetical protein